MIRDQERERDDHVEDLRRYDDLAMSLWRNQVTESPRDADDAS